MGTSADLSNAAAGDTLSLAARDSRKRSREAAGLAADDGARRGRLPHPSAPRGDASVVLPTGAAGSADAVPRKRKGDDAGLEPRAVERRPQPGGRGEPGRMVVASPPLEYREDTPPTGSGGGDAAVQDIVEGLQDRGAANHDGPPEGSGGGDLGRAAAASNGGD